MNENLYVESKEFADVLEACVIESDGVSDVINEIICDKTNEEVACDEMKCFTLEGRSLFHIDNTGPDIIKNSVNHPGSPEFNKTELELISLVKRLSKIEKFAVKQLERMKTPITEGGNSACNLDETKKMDWESALENKRKRKLFNDSDYENEEITYSGKDARTKEWIANYGPPMPIWCPPTPPQDDSDIYIDEALSLLYDQHLIPESQLPPVYIKKERKRTRLDGNILEGRLVGGIRAASGVRMLSKDDGIIFAPKCLFDRPTPALAKFRQEWRLQKHRGIRPGISSAHAALLKPQLPVKPISEPEHVPDWVIHEDWTILQAVQQVQEMNLNLLVISPGHTPNWDLIADMVNMTSRTYRSPKQCKNRYESVIIPREEGKPIYDSPKKHKKNKTLYKLPQMKGGRPLRTSQLFQQDNNCSMTQVMNSRFEAIRSVSNHRTPTVKPLLVDPAMKNPKHAEVLADSQIVYDTPKTPVEIAASRADRLAKEKMAHQGRVSGTETVVLRQQSLQTLVKQVPATSSSPARQLPSMTVQEMVVQGTRGAQVVSAVATVGTKQTVAVQPAAVTASSTSPATPALAKPATKTISAAQIALYRQQQVVLRQEVIRQQQLQQQQLKLLRAPAGSSPAPTKVFIAVTPPNAAPSPRIQQVKSGVGRPLTESEMVALLKRQQAAKAAQPNASSSSLATGQILTGIQVKALNAVGKTVSSQQMRQLSLQQQLLAAAVAQRNTKITQQKVTPIRPPTSQQ